MSMSAREEAPRAAPAATASSKPLDATSAVERARW
jgi:hypothetical protein